MTSVADLEFDQRHIWHPYTSMSHPLPCYPVSSAHGTRIYLEDGTALIDGMSSWWAAVHGYNHPALNAALQAQIPKMSHIMFGGITHQPAITLCRTLVDITPAKLECVFLSDSGSVAVEVAMKMALQYWQARAEPRAEFLTIKHGYHGDTFGAMSVCDPENAMHGLYRGFLPQHRFADAPQCGFNDPWDERDIASFAQQIEQHHQTLAAVILEPIVQGAGGMRIYHPNYLQKVRALCDQYGVLLIADEIATGFGRTGKLFACEHAGITPDILCLGKALTGGYLTLAATITTRHVADTVCNGEAGCFMHGPTFMANPLACSVANASLALLATGEWKTQVADIEAQLKAELLPLAELPHVAATRVLGAIGVVEMKEPVSTAQLQAQFVQAGVWIRPFGKLIYIMPPYIATQDDIRQLVQAIFHVISDKSPQITPLGEAVSAE
ncbi:MAG: adenosylmethionine--8-amino-7-oxononanoate transaminase [Plesiomonas sp.]|uniref:adenosylmethionine--8-amino-7-oxononanoate transaminase n=1 Tax=Plesiomonas sp. TaxID=2486279 RepID=UPI003EE81E51